jgi:tripartite-type tricarboxylate transporter receptor subunit TctC
MKKHSSRSLAAIAASTFLAFVSVPVVAAWPDDQPIKIIVPQPAGGTNDTLARLLSVELGSILKQTVIVENRPGAAGAIGMQAVSQSNPDGYTLGIASDSSALLDVMRPKLNWKFKRDLQGVGMIGDQPISVAVSALSPYKSIADVIKAAKAKPDLIAYGTSGVGSSQHVVGEWFAKLANIQLVHVPYKGGGQAIVDAVSGHVPMAVLGLAPMLAHAKTGSIRIVAVTSPIRTPTLPSVPTLTELGYPQISLSQWAGLVAPAGTPKVIVMQLSDALYRVVSGAETRKRLADLGVDAKPLEYQKFDKFLKDNVSMWESVVPSLNLKLD